VTGKVPHVRANHGSAIVGHNLYIFGGWSGTKRLNDLFTINLQRLQWSQIEYSGIKPNPRAGMPLVNYKNYLMLFGGSGSNSIYLNDLYFFDTGKKKIFFLNFKNLSF
jgi:leucine-zipper-like transcriptional regulator 1